MNALKSWIFLLTILSFSAHAIDLSNYKKEINSPLFQNISGWMNKGLLIKKRINLNKSVDRSPDLLEFKSAEDAFAVNYDFFTKDPEFKCRRPTYYKYFSSLFKTTPFSDVECKTNFEVTLISESTTGTTPMVARTIDPARVYQIHYLFAGKGKEMMSRWGHAMFRVITCAPGREVGPDCLQDYAYHIVVSYRANVEDMSLDYKKGMDGSYASQLFLMNMSEVVAEYTKGEFRDLISLPMKMNREEIAHFTDKLLENYWTYKGQYFFMTNNCATEAMNLLRVAYPTDAKIQTATIATPLGLYDYLVKNKIADLSILNDKKNAISKGYLFQGISDKLQKSLSLFADNKNLSFEDFAQKLTPAERLAIYEKNLGEHDGQITMLANALRLEEQILLSREQIFAKKLGNALFGKEPMPELKDTVLAERIIKMRDLYKKLSSESYLAPGYGIPLENEFRVASVESVKEIKEEIQASMEELRQIAVKFFPKEVEDMKGTMENRHWIMSKMDLN